MKIPRDISGKQLAGDLKKYGYEITRISGSHMRLTTSRISEHHITIPVHKPLRVGTISSILKEIAEHFNISKDDLIKELWR